mgnify:CR=1 FL=1
MIKKTAFLLLISVLSIVGCKRQKISKISDSLSNSKGNFYTVSAIPDSIHQPLTFHYLSTRSKISIRSKNQNIDNASVSFRIKKDSIIWMSANVMGVEVLRGIFSREGLNILDRFNKVYIQESYGSLAAKLGFPLDYPLLESFFLAEIPLYDGQRYEISPDSSFALVKQSDNYLSIYNLVDKKNGKTKRMEAIDLKTGNHAKSDYDRFNGEDEELFPETIHLELTLKSRQNPEIDERVTISVVHSAVNFSDSTMTFPFQVPNNFKKAF